MSLVIIQRFDNYFFANITYTMLHNAGIECYLRDENTIIVDPLLSNAIGGIKLEVRDTQVTEAMALVKEAEAAYLDDITCTYCNNKGLAVEEKIDTPKNIWGLLKNRVLYGQTNLYRKYYRCKTCNSQIQELPSSF